MPHLRDCVVPTQLGIVAGSAALSAIAYWVRMRRREDFGLSDALGKGVLGGLAGLVVGVTICVARHPPTVQTGTMGSWVSRFLSFAGLALIEGAIVGGVTVFLVNRALHGSRTPPGPGG